VNYLRVVRPNKRNWIGTLKPNGTKSGYSGLTDIIEDGLSISGLWMAPKATTIIHDMETVKPHMFPFLGRNLVKGINNIGGKGYGKKRMAARNKLHRGTKSALIRKNADFPLVSHCMNRDKPLNMRKSIMPNGEILIDTTC
jgi:hypothetical protein